MRRVTIVVLAAAIPAFAGTFFFKTDQILLYQERDRATLLLANTLGDVIEEIVLTFPGLIRLEDIYVHAGIMECRQSQRELVLAGALWRQGFVRLLWKPAFLLPLTITARSATQEWTLEVSNRFVYGEPEILKLPQGILVGRSESIGQTLYIRFAQPVTITSVFGIGCSPTWETSHEEIIVHGPFPPGSMVFVSWNHPEVQVKEVVWDDRPVSSAPIGPWEVLDLGNGRFRFSTTVAPGTQVLWDLGDGTTTTQRDFEHVYSHEGEYLVTLVLSDAQGQRRVRQKLVTVARPSYPTPTLVSLPPHAVPGGPYGPFDLWAIWDEERGQYVWEATVLFDASSSQAPGSSIVAYIWDLGDGQQIVTSSPYLNYTYKFTEENLPPYEAGYRRLTVTLTVVDEFGRTSTATTYILFYWWWIE